MSESVGIIGFVLLLITSGLSLADRSGKTALPFLLAVVALIANMMFGH
jgi:hypothetical protein